MKILTRWRQTIQYKSLWRGRGESDLDPCLVRISSSWYFIFSFIAREQPGRQVGLSSVSTDPYSIEATADYGGCRVRARGCGMFSNVKFQNDPWTTIMTVLWRRPQRPARPSLRQRGETATTARMSGGIYPQEKSKGSAKMRSSLDMKASLNILLWMILSTFQWVGFKKVS